jgi:hypothetical protein
MVDVAELAAAVKNRRFGRAEYHPAHAKMATTGKNNKGGVAAAPVIQSLLEA